MRTPRGSFASLGIESGQHLVLYGMRVRVLAIRDTPRWSPRNTSSMVFHQHERHAINIPPTSCSYRNTRPLLGYPGQAAYECWIAER